MLNVSAKIFELPLGEKSNFYGCSNLAFHKNESHFKGAMLAFPENVFKFVNYAQGDLLSKLCTLCNQIQKNYIAFAGSIKDIVYWKKHSNWNMINYTALSFITPLSINEHQSQIAVTSMGGGFFEGVFYQFIGARMGFVRGKGNFRSYGIKYYC